MNEEELKQLVESNKQLKEEVEGLKKNQKEQNSYITKLEQKLKDKPEPSKPSPQPSQPQQQPQQTRPPSRNQAVDKYIWDRMVRDIVGEKMESLKDRYPKDHVEKLHTDVLSYAKKNMTEDTASDKFVQSVFEMLYGRALGNPEHAIHQRPEEKPAETPEDKPKETPEQPQAKPKAPSSQDFTPPTMSNTDRTPAPGNVPDHQEPQYKTVKESSEALRARLSEARTTSE